jgi:hypothetical protein
MEDQDNIQGEGAANEQPLSPVEQLERITVSDGADIYLLAHTVRQFLARGESFKLDSRANLLPKFNDGYTVQVVPHVHTQPNEEMKAVLRGVIENDLIVSIGISFLESGLANLVIGFLKHFDLESDAKAFCRQVGKNVYVDHAFNDLTGLQALSYIPFNPTDREVLVLESKINSRMRIHPDMN